MSIGLKFPHGVCLNNPSSHIQPRCILVLLPLMHTILGIFKVVAYFFHVQREKNFLGQRKVSLSTPLSLTCDVTNCLVGFTHTAFVFGYEAGINKSPIDGNLVPPGALIRFVQKGFQYLEMEANLSNVSKCIILLYILSHLSCGCSLYSSNFHFLLI